MYKINPENGRSYCALSRPDFSGKHQRKFYAVKQTHAKVCWGRAGLYVDKVKHISLTSEDSRRHCGQCQRSCSEEDKNCNGQTHTNCSE